MHMNSNFAVDFEGVRCPQGYRIAKAKELKQAEFRNPDEPLILANSEELSHYRPEGGPAAILAVFTRVKTQDDFFKFVTQYGQIWATDPDKGQAIVWGLYYAKQFRSLLAAKSKGPKKLAEAFSSRHRVVWAQLYPEAKIKADTRVYVSADEFVGEIHLFPDPARGVCLRLVNWNLIAWLWWQLSLKLTGATSYHACRQCGDLFEVGPGTGVRADATFCCNEHSVLFHSLARRKGA